MQGERHDGRTVLEVTGADRVDFLQGLVTNDVSSLGDGPRYAALLSPQGKYLADFFLVEDGARVLVDVASVLAPGLVKRLSMYKLRADVTIGETDLQVRRGLDAPPPGAWADPRHPALGWRLLAEADADETAEPDGQGDGAAWEALRVAHCIPESGIELLPNETLILEAGFERMGGVDFRKGCYVGQEVTARMKHKTALRKGFVTVPVALPEGAAPPAPGTEITHEGKVAGALYTVAGDRGIAHLRFDRAGEGMAAGDARVDYAPGA